MRILIVSNLYSPEFIGGYEILCTQVVESLMRRGHSLAVLTTPCTRELPEPSPERTGPKPVPGVPAGTGASRCSDKGPAGEAVVRDLSLYLPFGEPGRLDRLGMQRVERKNRRVAAQIIESFKPDVVFVWSQLRLGLGAAREAESRDLPVVYTMNDDHILGFQPRSTTGFKGFFRMLLERFILPASTWKDLRFDPAVVISATLRKHLADADPRFSRAVFAYQGVPIEKFPLKTDPGSAQDPFRVLYAGQLHDYKGVHTLIEAMGILAGRGRFTLSVAGAGNPDYEARLKSRAAELKIDARFLGRLPSASIGSLYRESDLLAFTSIWDEPFGLTHLEAMASGTPVVSVGHGGPGEFLRDGENALIFRKEDEIGRAHV